MTNWPQPAGDGGSATPSDRKPPHIAGAAKTLPNGTPTSEAGGGEIPSLCRRQRGGVGEKSSLIRSDMHNISQPPEVGLRNIPRRSSERHDDIAGKTAKESVPTICAG
ncbi:MAG: hypothetical protein DMG43_02760 [Acidobacteria bacterium]|nr:MAG: hypothetical protein DMG43_02760 [Acidobacteriota bacterium]